MDAGNGENHGQVIIGEIGSEATMKRPDRLPTMAELFPEMVNVDLDAADDRPSCSVAESLQKQSLVINTAMATEIFNLLWTLFQTGSLKYSGRFVNLQSGVSTPIRLDTDVWAQMGYTTPEPKNQRISRGAKTPQEWRQDLFQPNPRTDVHPRDAGAIFSISCRRQRPRRRNPHHWPRDGRQQSNMSQPGIGP